MSTTGLPSPPPRTRRPTLAFGPFTFDPDNHLLRRGVGRDPGSAARAGPARDPARARRRPRVASGSDRPGLEGRVRDRHVARRGGQRAAADPGRRAALADLHPDRAPTRLPVRRPGRSARPAGAEPGRRRRRPPETTSCRPSIGGQLVPWSLAILSGLLAAIAVFQLTHRLEPAPVAGRFAIQLDAGQRFDSRGSARGARAGRIAGRVGRMRRQRLPPLRAAARPARRDRLAWHRGCRVAVLLARRWVGRLLRGRKAQENVALRRSADDHRRRGSTARSGVDSRRPHHLRQLARRRAVAGVRERRTAGRADRASPGGGRSTARVALDRAGRPHAVLLHRDDARRGRARRGWRWRRSRAAPA